MVLFASLLTYVPVLLKVLDFLQDAFYYVKTFLPIVLGFLH
ncbi:MAG TPA: hypothetical protein VIU39_02545 [Anaerolineales bacterium]|jgi:hypothetical protein